MLEQEVPFGDGLGGGGFKKISNISVRGFQQQIPPPGPHSPYIKVEGKGLGVGGSVGWREPLLPLGSPTVGIPPRPSQGGPGAGGASQTELNPTLVKNVSTRMCPCVA